MYYHNNMSTGSWNKKKRGGQPGNQNARKHGFYSAAMNLEETGEYWQAIRRDGADPQLAVFRIKLVSALRHDPSNRRVLREAFRILNAHYNARLDLTAQEAAFFRRFLWMMLETAADQFNTEAEDGIDITMEKTSSSAGTNGVQTAEKTKNSAGTNRDQIAGYDNRSAGTDRAQKSGP